jgi:hypothetical protein
MANEVVNRLRNPPVHTKLSRHPPQITGFWGAWAGLDAGRHGFGDLRARPQPGAHRTASQVRVSKPLPPMSGSPDRLLFALFLVGWGLSLIWGPIADKFGRSRVLAATIFVYAIFTGAAALSQTVWQLALFRLLAGIGIGGEWALAGTYVAEAWPEDRRKMGAGYLQTGYYAGFFLASALNYTVARALRLARHVLVRPHARHRRLHGSVPREGAAALATRSQSQSCRWTFSSAPDLQRAVHATHAGQHGPAGLGHLRPVGGCGLCSHGNHQPGETGTACCSRRPCACLPSAWACSRWEPFWDAWPFPR